MSQTTSAAQGELNANKFAARKARLPQRASFPTAAAAMLPALLAAGTMSPQEEWQASHNQERITHGTPPLNLPTFDDAYKMSPEDEEAQQTAEDDLTENYAMNRAGSDGDYDYSGAKAQSREKSIRHDLNVAQDSAAERNLITEIKSVVPGVTGDVDIPCEDGGVTLATSMATLSYQAIVTIFPEVGDKIDATPLAAILPPRFNYKSAIGMGGIVNATFLFLIANSEIVITLAVFLLIVVLITAVANSWSASLSVTKDYISSMF